MIESYALRIQQESIEKIDNSQFPGSERQKASQSDLLIPKLIKTEKETDAEESKPAEAVVTPKMPKLSLIDKPKEDINEAQADVEPMGVYGHTVKMPSLTLKTQETEITPMGVYGHIVKMPSLTLESSVSPVMGVYGHTVKMPSLTLEADSASTFPALTRAKESKFISTLRSRFMESVGSDETAPATMSNRYLVTLISEGLGNLGDGFYYTANALQSGAALFEGQKCYANHPSAVEEQVLPERSVRDIIGHFENIQCVQNGDHMEMQGVLVIMDGPSYQWVLSQLNHALGFSQKYADKDFIGLSINAGGQATPMPIDQFISSFPIPESCLPKVQNAQADGLAQVKIVDQITEAVSCDLVTQAGAGGRVIQAL